MIKDYRARQRESEGESEGASEGANEREREKKKRARGMVPTKTLPCLVCKPNRKQPQPTATIDRPEAGCQADLPSEVYTCNTSGTGACKSYQIRTDQIRCGGWGDLRSSKKKKNRRLALLTACLARRTSHEPSRCFPCSFSSQAKGAQVPASRSSPMRSCIHPYR